MKFLQNVFPFVEILRISTPKFHLIVDGITAYDYKILRRNGISLDLIIIFLWNFFPRKAVREHTLSLMSPHYIFGTCSLPRNIH